ncbi:MAG: hypothetical protein ACRDOB_20300 [Streptosporangiaceae bacterium]
MASAAIGAAVREARDYAAALDARLHHVEHVAGTGLLGCDTAPYEPGECRPVHFFGFGGGGRKRGSQASYRPAEGRVAWLVQMVPAMPSIAGRQARISP